MAKRKRRWTLPRVSVLALDRRELATFAADMESLRYIVAELREQVERLTILPPRSRSRKAAPANGQPTEGGTA